MHMDRLNCTRIGRRTQIRSDAKFVQPLIGQTNQKELPHGTAKLEMIKEQGAGMPPFPVVFVLAVQKASALHPTFMIAVVQLVELDGSIFGSRSGRSPSAPRMIEQPLTLILWHLFFASVGMSGRFSGCVATCAISHFRQIL